MDHLFDLIQATTAYPAPQAHDTDELEALVEISRPAIRAIAVHLSELQGAEFVEDCFRVMDAWSLPNSPYHRMTRSDYTCAMEPKEALASAFKEIAGAADPRLESMINILSGRAEFRSDEPNLRPAHRAAPFNPRRARNDWVEDALSPKLDAQYAQISPLTEAYLDELTPQLEKVAANLLPLLEGANQVEQYHAARAVFHRLPFGPEASASEVREVSVRAMEAFQRNELCSQEMAHNLLLARTDFEAGFREPNEPTEEHSSTRPRMR